MDKFQADFRFDVETSIGSNANALSDAEFKAKKKLLLKWAREDRWFGEMSKVAVLALLGMLVGFAFAHVNQEAPFIGGIQGYGIGTLIGLLWFWWAQPSAHADLNAVALSDVELRVREGSQRKRSRDAWWLHEGRKMAGLGLLGMAMGFAAAYLLGEPLLTGSLCAGMAGGSIGQFWAGWRWHRPTTGPSNQTYARAVNAYWP